MILLDTHVAVWLYAGSVTLVTKDEKFELITIRRVGKGVS